MGRIGGAGAPSGPMPTPKGMSFGQTNGKRDVGALYFPIRRGSLVVSHIHESVPSTLFSGLGPRPRLIPDREVFFRIPFGNFKRLDSSLARLRRSAHP